MDSFLIPRTKLQELREGLFYDSVCGDGVHYSGEAWSKGLLTLVFKDQEGCFLGSERVMCVEPAMSSQSRPPHSLDLFL